MCATSFLIVFDLFGPFDPLSVFRFGFLSQILSSNEKSSRLACDYSHGRWVRDESNKNQSYTESCPFLDPGFRCVSKWKKVSELAMAARRVWFAKVWKLIIKLSRCLHALDASLNVGFLKSPRK